MGCICILHCLYTEERDIVQHDSTIVNDGLNSSLCLLACIQGELMVQPQGLIGSKGSKVGVKMWFKWTKYSDQTNFESKVLYERNKGHWSVFRIRFTWSKYLGVAVFLRPKYWNSLVMKMYKRRSHYVNCLANMADTARGKFNLQLQSPSWNYDPNFRMRLDLKKMVQHQDYTWSATRWYFWGRAHNACIASQALYHVMIYRLYPYFGYMIHIISFILVTQYFKGYMFA